MHPKFLRLSDGAYRLWDHGLHFANRATTDGFVEKDLIATLNHHGRWTAKQLQTFAGELVAVGLWVDDGDRWKIHDYEKHQAEALKDRVEERRAYERQKKASQRSRRTDSSMNPSKTSNVPGGLPGGIPKGVPGGVPMGVPAPDPSRIKNEEEARARPTVVESDPDDPAAVHVTTTKPKPAVSFDRQYVRRVFSAYWQRQFGRKPVEDFQTDPHKLISALNRAVDWAKQENPEDPKLAIRAEAHAFLVAKLEEIESGQVTWALFYWLSRIGTWVTEAERLEAANV